MEERNVIKFKKEEFAVREYIKNSLGKGRISRVKIEYTPVGEKIIISTNKPGLVIGRKGDKIFELTKVLKDRFKLENPHIEIDEIMHPEFDAQIMADEIALGLERFGPLKFKVIAYKALQRIMNAGALGTEIRLSGKLPSSRAKTWRFAQGYMIKTGDSAKVVDRAQSTAQTRPGTVGVKVSILSPEAVLKDKIEIKWRVSDPNKENALIEIYYPNETLYTNSTDESVNISISKLTLLAGNYRVHVYGEDEARNSIDTNTTLTIQDTTSPNIVSSSPVSQTQFLARTTNLVIELTTDEKATCKVSNTNSAWDNMTIMNYTNKNLHNYTAESLSNGQSYTYYFLCQDELNNRMDNSYNITFSVAQTQTTGQTQTGGGSGGSGRIVQRQKNEKKDFGDADKKAEEKKEESDVEEKITQEEPVLEKIYEENKEQVQEKVALGFSIFILIALIFFTVGFFFHFHEPGDGKRYFLFTGRKK